MKDHNSELHDRSQQGSHLDRTLQNRHIQLIAIGGAIGTGLFMGSGKTISLAGPSILFVYLVIGSILYLFMRLMGELLLSNSRYATFADIAHDLLGPIAGFLTGWTYWFCWVVTAIADLIAIVGYTHFWWPQLPAWIPILLIVGFLFSLNALTVKAFGEIEFWFALVKIFAIVALIVVGLWMVFRHTPNETGDPAALSNLWSHGGLFPLGFYGFLAGFPIAIFAFVGIELVGTTVAETKNPETMLPKAINSIPMRIMLFYIGALAVIMMVTPWNHVDPSKSPFVTMFALTGLAAAASIVNIVVLSSAASSANSGIYSTSRMLWGLAHRGDAPTVFRVLSRRRVPRNALFLTCVLLLSSIVLIAAGESIIQAFTMITAMASTLVMAVWAIITIAYLKFRTSHPDLHRASVFPAPWGTVSAWLVLIFITAMVCVLAFEPDTRIGLLASAAWLIGLGTAAKIRQRQRHSNEADVHSSE